MEWTDNGVVLGVRRHGEANAIVELMTRGHGRHLGLVRGGVSSRMRPILQPGNLLRAVWGARLDEHLGHFRLEGLKLRAAEFLALPHALFAVAHLTALARFLPERDPHPDVYEALEAIFDNIDDAAITAALAVRFELSLLSELGFGLDLLQCAAGGTSSDLVYVSPKSGRAVSRVAGDPWRDRLLKLPKFLSEESDDEFPSLAELEDGFALTGYFLTRRVLEPREEPMPHARDNFIAAVRRVLAPAA